MTVTLGLAGILVYATAILLALCLDDDDGI